MDGERTVLILNSSVESFPRPQPLLTPQHEKGFLWNTVPGEFNLQLLFETTMGLPLKEPDNCHFWLCLGRIKLLSPRDQRKAQCSHMSILQENIFFRWIKQELCVMLRWVWNSGTVCICDTTGGNASSKKQVLNTLFWVCVTHKSASWSNLKCTQIKVTETFHLMLKSGKVKQFYNLVPK